MFPLCCHGLLRISQGKKLQALLLPERTCEVSCPPPEALYMHFLQDGCQNRPLTVSVSGWDESFLNVRFEVHVDVSCRAFDTLKAQIRSSWMRPARPWLYGIWESTRFRSASCFYRSRIYKHPARQHTVDRVFLYNAQRVGPKQDYCRQPECIPVNKKECYRME